MGISGLLPFIKKASRHSHIRHFSGCTAAVDAYGWLYKGAFGCAEKLGKGEPTTIYVTYCMKYVNVLISNGIKPVLVFDGRNLPAKAVTDDKRRENRMENEAKAKDALRKGKSAWEYFVKCLHVTPKMARELIKALREKKIDYIIAPYEADAQLAYLARKGIVDLVITEDSDLVLFGCPKIFFKLSMQGDGVVFDQSRIHLTMGQTPEQFQFDKFRQMCILSGCDYLPSLPGIGLGRAKKMFQMSTNPDVRKVLKQLPAALKLEITVSDEYIEQFICADNTFKFQLVFDPTTRSVVPLTPYPPGITPAELEYAGKYEKKALALDYALGNVDIHTNERVDSFDPNDSKSGYTKNSMWVNGFAPQKKTNLTIELKAKTKHSSTNGITQSVKMPAIKKLVKAKLRQEDDAQEDVGDQDLLTMYGITNSPVVVLESDIDINKNERQVSKRSSQTQSQEEEDAAILSQSSNRSKRICLRNSNSFYEVKKSGSDGESSEQTDSNADSNEEDTTITQLSDGNLDSEIEMPVITKPRNPFLKSPKTPTRKSSRIAASPLLNLNKAEAKTTKMTNAASSNPNPGKNIDYRSRFFRTPSEELERAARIARVHAM